MCQDWATVGSDDVEELRALLRRRDRAAREIGVAVLRSWTAGRLDARAARALLDAASEAYPDIDGCPEHLGEMLVHLLWEEPELVEAPDVVRVHLVAGERTRRALIHLLALRRDESGLQSLGSIMGPEAPDDLLPMPTSPLLDPLADHPDRAGVTDLLLGLLPRQGWTWHASRLLCRLQADGRADRGARQRILESVAECSAELVQECDVAALADPRSGDGGRSARQALASLVRLLDELAELDQQSILGRMLASADPRVAVMGAVRLLGRDEPVAPERIRLIARDPAARADLHDGLVAFEPELAAELAGDVLEPLAVAEGELARWLSEVTELGRAPDELELVATVTLREPDAGPLHVFRFRMRAPHWSASRGWMIGVAGTHTTSCYAAEDECSIDEHVAAVLSSLADWPDHRADGAA
jgi:hypothetical protein